MTTVTIPEVLAPIEDYIEDTKLVAFDGCHKIYMALDDTKADWFRQEYPFIVQNEKDDMLQAVVNWFEKSCSLKFVSGVVHDAEDPNRGFATIVGQFAEEESEVEECWYCGDRWCDEECQEEDEEDEY